MLNNLHVWVFVKWELKELKLGVKESQVPSIWKKFRIKESLSVLVISKKLHRIAGFHENPKKRSQAGFWAVILHLQFGIWVSGPRQTDRRDLGFKTSIDKLTELMEILKKSPSTSSASPSPTPQNSRHRQTNRTKWINYIDCGKKIQGRESVIRWIISWIGFNSWKLIV
jgi:hypothetical protein